MTGPGRYDVDFASRDIHAVVLRLGESLDEDQLRWRPDDFATSIGFHLWHLGRESDFLHIRAMLSRGLSDNAETGGSQSFTDSLSFGRKPAL